MSNSSSNPTYGGICLDGLKKIPENYRDILHIGKNVFIKSGTILAGEGFHFRRDEYNKLIFTPHRHGVQILDDVHVGSHCTIDRGRVRDTIIGKGTKIDNGTHISHNCVIGENCIIGQGASILGSVEIGNNSEIWSHSTIHQGVKVGNNCAVGANTYLRKNVPDNHVAFTGLAGLVIKPMNESKKYKKRGGGVSKALNGKSSNDSSW